MALQDLTPQLRTRLSRVEWFVGLFLGVTALLMIAGFGSYLKKTADARGWLVTEVPYYTYLTEASGLKVGSPVQMMGFKVGEVTRVTALPRDTRQNWDHYVTNNFNVFVSFKVRDDKNDHFPGFINSDARVKVGGFPSDLLGGTHLEVTEGTSEGVQTYGTAPNNEPGVLWDQFAITPPGKDRTNKFKKYGPLTNDSQGFPKGYYVQVDQSETLVEGATRLMARVDHIAGTIDKVLPPLTADLQATLSMLREAMPGLTNQVELLLLTARQTLPGLTNNLDQVLVNTRDLTAQLRDTLPMLTNSLEQTLVTTRQLGSELNRSIPMLTSNINLTLTNVNVILTRDTNITANSSVMVSNVNQLLTRHWLFRSAFKDKKPKK